MVGFFDTLYWTRRFRRAIEAKKTGRMASVPQLDVPEIYVQDESEDMPHGSASPLSLRPTTPLERISFDMPDSPRFSPYSIGSGRATGASISDAGSSPGTGTGSVLQMRRSDSIQRSPSASPTRTRGYLFGHSAAASTASVRDDWQFADALHTRPPSPGHLALGDAASDGAGDGRSRAVSAVSAQNVLEVLDNSAWGESIRRSFTQRRPSNGSGGHGGPGGQRRLS